MSIDNKQRTLANIIELIITILDHLIPMHFIILRRKKKCWIYKSNISLKYIGIRLSNIVIISSIIFANVLCLLYMLIKS